MLGRDGAAGDPQPPSGHLLRRRPPDGNDHGVVRGPQVLEGHIAADPHISPHFDAKSKNVFDLPPQYVAGELVFRNLAAQHAAEIGMVVEDRAGVAVLCEVVGGRQPGRTAADYCHALAG